VRDTGAGIGAADLERLFEPFEQVVDGRPPEPGAGLGLAISRQLVERLGGHLEARSEPGTGSVFSFVVPLRSAPPGAAPGAPLRRIDGYEGPRRRVLIVDDVDTNRRLCRELLQSVGFEVIEAFSGLAALETLATGTVDAALIDLRLPGMDGLELVRRLRRQPGEAPKLIATTASVFSFDRVTALAAGCDDFLPKPFRAEQLFDVLRDHLGLEWRLADDRGQADRGAPRPATVPGSVPPAATLRVWLEAARAGDVVALESLLAERRRQVGGNEAIVAEIDRLLGSYRLGAIREVLDRALERAEGHDGE
jgi:CheY-like chemotaxis protein